MTGDGARAAPWSARSASCRPGDGRRWRSRSASILQGRIERPGAARRRAARAHDAALAVVAERHPRGPGGAARAPLKRSALDAALGRDRGRGERRPPRQRLRPDGARPSTPTTARASARSSAATTSAARSAARWSPTSSARPATTARRSGRRSRSTSRCGCGRATPSTGSPSSTSTTGRPPPPIAGDVARRLPAARRRPGAPLRWRSSRSSTGASRRLRHQAQHDTLTGLPNRTALLPPRPPRDARGCGCAAGSPGCC